MLTTILAATISVNLHGASIHQGDRLAYNEENWGVGLRVNDWSADAFLDSYRNPAGFAGRVYEVEHHGLFFGATVGYVHHTHYKGIGPVPHIRWQGRYIGVRSIIVPSSSGVVMGLSLVVPWTAGE